MHISYRTGQHDEFYWIEFDESDFSLKDLTRNFPKIFEKKYLAVVCFDSGPLGLVDEEKEQGWYEKDEISYSPQLDLNLISKLPCDGFDQWVLFSTATEFSGMTDFVNYTGFTLTDRSHELETLDSSPKGLEMAGIIEHLGDLTEQFWEELRVINPVNYISDGSKFIFVSKKIEEIDLLIRHF